MSGEQFHDIFFNYPVQPFQVRAFMRRELEATKRLQVSGHKAQIAINRSNEISCSGFNELVESTRQSFAQYGQFDDSEYEGISYLSSDVFDGFTDVSDKLADINEALNFGFREVASLFEDISEELGDIHCDITEGFDRLGALFDWGFSELIVQAELHNKSLQQIIKILLRPVTTEAKDLLAHAINNYRRQFSNEALESFSFLLKERKYRVVLGTYFPIHQFVANIYFYDRRDYEKAAEYYGLAYKYAPESATRLRALLQLQLGRCCYYRQMFLEARECAKQSLALCPSSEARYQYAQYCALSGDSKEALVNLQASIEGDSRYAFKVVNEPDFVSIRDEVINLLVKVKRDRVLRSLKGRLTEEIKLLRGKIAGDKKMEIDTVDLEDLLKRFEKEVDIINQYLGRDRSNLTATEFQTTLDESARRIAHCRSLFREAKEIISNYDKNKGEVFARRAEQEKKEEKKREMEVPIQPGFVLFLIFAFLFLLAILRALFG